MQTRILAACAALIALSGCERSYQDLPPNDIGMMLTPTGYEKKIYTPGQVDIGQLQNDGRGNSLVLIQRSGIQVKESFAGPDANADKEDHRCLTADGAPMTLDVRLLFALPDYSTPQGRKDLERIFLLGNPTPLKKDDENSRVMQISASAIYADQAQQAVRGKIRQICGGYADFTAAYHAFTDTTKDGMVKRVENSVASVLRETNVPLQLMSAYASNMKPDPTVIRATAQLAAARKQIEAMKVVADYVGNDPTRTMIYEAQVMQEVVGKANANGHNTVIMGMGAGASPLMLRGK